MKAEVGKRYQHYKGKTYVVLAIGYDSENLQEVVVYRGEYTDPEFGENPVWVRPLGMFEEKIIVDGKAVDRFTRIEDIHTKNA